MKRRAVFLIGLILPVALMTPVIGGARAEGFVDLRAGGSFSQDTDETVTVGPMGTLPAQTSSAKTGFEFGVTLGLGGGYWLDAIPWLGFALDVGFFKSNENASADPLKLDVIPIAGLLMLRYPLLESDTYPAGRLQPYLGIGPAGFVSSAELIPKNLGLAGKFNDTTTDIGFYAQLGIKYLFEVPGMPGKSYGLFLEQGFTRFDPSAYRDVVDTVPIKIDLDPLNTWHTTAGLAFHF